MRSSSMITGRAQQGVIHKGSYVLMEIGSDPEEMRYALLHQIQYNEYINIQRQKFRTRFLLTQPDTSMDEPVEKDCMNQIAFILNQMVYKVSIDYAIEQNQDIIEEMRYFQEDCWENEQNMIRKKYEIQQKKNIRLNQKK